MYESVLRTISVKEYDLTELSTDARLQLSIFAAKIDEIRCRFNRNELCSPSSVYKQPFDETSHWNRCFNFQRKERDRRFKSELQTLPSVWSGLISLCIIHETFDMPGIAPQGPGVETYREMGTLHLACQYLLKYGEWTMSHMPWNSDEDGNDEQQFKHSERYWSCADHTMIFNWFTKTTVDQKDWSRMYKWLQGSSHRNPNKFCL